MSFRLLMLPNSSILQAKHRYKCDQCDSWFQYPSGLSNHVRFKHDPSGEDAFCPYCYRTGFFSFMTYKAHYIKCQKRLRTWIGRRVRNRGMRSRSAHERAVMRAALKIPHSVDTLRRCGQGVSVAVMYTSSTL